MVGRVHEKEEVDRVDEERGERDGDGEREEATQRVKKEKGKEERGREGRESGRRTGLDGGE